MSVVQAWIDGIAVIGPGIADWASARAVLSGRAEWVPAATQIPSLTVLPPAERRRVGAVVRLALAAGLQACTAAQADAARLPTVFASSGGDGSNCHGICEALASDDRLISPIRFHNSVNNAASGYWGIATGAMTPSAIVSAYDGSFAAGLLEALVQLATPDETAGRILLIAHDLPYPAPLAATRPLGEPFAVGLLLSLCPGPQSLARLAARLCEPGGEAMAEPQFEALRCSTPAARALPLLQAVAGLDGIATTRELVLDYLPELSLALGVAPAA